MNIRVLLRAVLLRAVVVLAMVAGASSAFAVTKTWDAGAGNNLWSNATNWSPNGLPGGGDDVVITNATSFDSVSLDVLASVKSIDIGNGATLNVAGGGGVLFLIGPGMSTVQSGGELQLEGGTPAGGVLSGGGALTVDGIVGVHGNCFLDGTGALTINNNGELQIGSTGAGAVMNISRNITNNTGGKIIFLSTSVAHTTFSGITITNAGLIDFQNGYNLVVSSGSPILNNNSGGVIRKTVINSVTVIYFTVNNAAGATIDAQVGVVVLRGGGTLSGAHAISSGSELLLGPAANTFTMSGSPTVSGAGALRVVGSATLNLGAGVDVTVPNLDLLESGTITGAGDLRVSDSFSWSGGTISGSGTRELQSTSSSLFSCDDCLLDGAALQLQGSATFGGGDLLVLSNAASLTIDAGKTLHINGSFDFSSGGGAASNIINNGTIWKHSSNPCTIGVAVTLSGTSTVRVDGGTLGFGGGASVAAGGTLDINGTLEVTGGVFLFSSGSVPMPGSGDFKVSAGTLRVPTGITTTIPNLTLEGSGVIDGGGTLILSGTSTWAGGTMGSAAAPGGITRIDSGNTLNVTAAGGPTLTQSRLLQNNGALNLTSDGNLNLSGSATIENNGTVTKNAGAGTATIHPRVENNDGATVSAAVGTVALSGGGVANGAYSISTFGQFIRLDGGTFTMSGNPTVTGPGALVIDGATLDAGAGVDVTLAGFGLFSGTLTGAGAVRVSGQFYWSGGTIAGSGSRVLDGAAEFACAVGDCLLDGAALQLQTHATYSTSSNALVFSNGASLTIDPGKSISINNGGDFIDGGGAASSIINNGMFWKGASNVSSTIGVPVTLSGTSTVAIDDGVLQFGAGASVAAGATLDIDANKTLEVTGGVFLFNSGTVSLPGSGGNFKVSSGTLRVPTGVTVDLPDVTLQGSGVIDGGGTLILSGAPLWLSGTMGSAAAPGGITRIDSGINPLNVGGIGPQALIEARQLLNNGTVNYSSTVPNILTMSNDSKITNNGALNFSTNGTIDLAGSALIENNGTMTKVAGFGTSTIYPRVENNNGGTVSAANAFGVIALHGGGIAAGAYSIASGATISLAGGTFTVANTATVTGAGTLHIFGATLDAGSGVDITCPNVEHESGTITGPGTVRVSGNFTWSGGTITGSGPRVLNSTSVPAISCSNANCVLDGGTLQIQAWGAYSASSNALVLSNGASLVIDPGKVLFVTNDGDFVNGGGAASSIVIGGFSGVNGCIEKTTTSGTSIIGIPVTMEGSFKTVAGTLQVGADVTAASGAIFHYDPGTTIEVTAGVFLLNSNSISFPANGDFKVSGGTLRVPAGVTVTARNVTLEDSGVIDGGGTLNLSGTSTWSAGTMMGSGTTAIPAAMSLGITAPVALSRTLQNDGTLTVSGDITGSGTIDNGGTLNTLADLTIGTVLNNSGQVVTANALSLAGGGTHTGSFTVTAPGNLSFSSGTHSMSGGGSITGTGTLAFSGATATVGVPVNAGALSITAGTATLDANGSADAFTMTGGTLGGSGTLTLNNGGTWSGGTWFGGITPGSGTTINPAAKTLSISAPVTLSGRTLQNDGTLSVSGNVAGSGTIANNGTLDPAANVTIGAALNNSGQVATSTLLSLGGNGAHSGTFTVTAPGVIDFSGGTQTISGTLAGTGTLRFSGAAATVSGTWSGMPIEVTGGSVGLDTNGTILALTLSGGTLTGSGDVTVSGPSTWSGGTIAGSGDFKFDTGATVTMPGTNPVTLARSLRNQGTINFIAASNGMLIDGVRLRNDGTFDIQSSQAIAATAGTPSFLNSGTLKKSSGEGVMQFGAPLSNSGQVRIESGIMQFGGAYAQSSGRTTVLSGAKLQAATVSLNGGSLTGNGTVAGTLANDATVSPGASPGTLTVSGDYVQSSGGTLEIQLNGTAPGTQYDRLLVSGNVTLGGTLDVTSTHGFIPTPGNAFQILTFGSRTGNSTFDVMTGLGGLVPSFSATDLKLVSTVITPLAADVAVGLNGPASTIAGRTVIYTVTVSNSGPDPATNIAVTATASPGLTFRGNSGACVGSFPCNITTLGPGQSTTIHSAWDIAPSASGSVQWTVHASAAADPNSSNDSDTAVTNIGTCPDITISAPGEMTTGLTAEAAASDFGGAAYHWSIVNGTIDRGNGTAAIEFTAGEPGTTTLTVHVIGGGCTLNATFDVTIKARCVGTAMPTTPGDGTVTADAVVEFGWSVVDDASGYRLWLQQDGAPARNLGTALGTSRTRIIPPGVYQWYVETLFDGCASHESERRTLTVLPGQDCANREAPQLGAPLNETPATSAAVAFSWNAVAQALEYELWLAPAGGVPTLIRNTPDTSYTAVVPPGRLEWYVRAIFAGCAATESAHRSFTYTPPAGCTSERPLLIAPVEGERLTSPVSFEWTSVSGATSYELYVDGMLAATTASPHLSGLPLPRAERHWQVRARLGESCGAVDSAESRLVVIAPSPSCAPLGSPVVSAPARISSGTLGRIQWSFVAGATAYEVEISGDPRFPRGATSSSTVTARQMPITFTNQGSAPVERYVRVHAVDTNCVQPGSGAFSPVAVVSVLPPAGSATGNEGVALLTDPTDVPYTLSVGAELAGQSFTATPTVPWLSVTPTGGIVPPGGQTLRAVARTAGLPAGTSTGSIEITTTAAAGGLEALATTPPVKLTIAVNNIPGVFTAPKSTPPPDALVIPAVASVNNFIVRYDSDICVTNTSAQVMRYEINFVPSGQAGLSEGQKTNVSLVPGATMAMNDIVATWFGGRTSTGTLEIRPLTEIDTSTSSAPVGGLANRITFASSRTFSTTAAGGTYGQYVPAVPYANFVSEGSTLSLQHIAQSDKYRTNLGLVEGSGEKVSLEVRIFDAAGTRRAAFPVDLNGGERTQLNGVLQEHGVTLDDGRIEVEVTSGAGKVTAYASVLDNETNDSQIVPPVTLDHVGHSKWVVPGVADLVSGTGNWLSDLRIYNAGTEAADLTLAFYSMNGGPPTTRTIPLAAGEVRQFDRVLSFFAIAGDAGALHISSAAPAQIVATARTYKQTPEGAFGQFIAAVTPEEAVAAGTRPLQILQMEESSRFKSNIGFAEVSGKPLTLEVTVFRPNSTAPAVLQVELEPNQFKQINLASLFPGLGEMYNARISVRAISGEGRALAYGSLIDHKTGDPTYIPGQ